MSVSTKKDIVLGPYFVSPEHRGKGYAKVIVRMTLEYCTYDYECAYDWIHDDNYASIKTSEACGMVKEGERMVKAVRDRYAGNNRNPFNEIECGNNYARSMASYALIPIYSGFECDMTRGYIGFDPIKPCDFRAPFALEGAWGVVETREDALRLDVKAGALQLQSLGLHFEPKTARVDGKEVAFTAKDGAVVFAQPIYAEKEIVLR